MKCFKHLCAKLFLCLGFFGGWGLVSEVNAAEITDTTEAAEAAIATDTTVTEEDLTAADDADAALLAYLAAVAEARAQDVDRLSRVIQTEGGTFDDKVCVGLTVLHRKDSPQFPDTVEENINAPSQYAKPAYGEVLPENQLAAEYAMRLWESGMSYSVLPDGYLYFAGNGKRNRFRNAEGNHYNAPEIAQLFIPYTTTEGPDGALILLGASGRYSEYKSPKHFNSTC